MGTGARKIESLSSQNTNMLIIEYSDGRRASMLQMTSSPFKLSLQLKGGESIFIEHCTDMFPGLIDMILTFFQTREIPVPREETLEIMALIECGSNAIKNYDIWIELPKIFL